MDLAAWRAAICQQVVPLEIQEVGGVPFRGHLDRVAVDDVMMFQIAATPHRVLRTEELIGRRDGRFYKLSLQLVGQARLCQDGRETLLDPGDLAVYDTHRPYELEFSEHNQAMVIVFPHELIDLPRDEVARVTATRFSPETGLGRVINPFFTELGRNMDQMTDSHGSRLVQSALDLLITMLSQELHSQDDAGGPARSLAAEVREYILVHLGDPELTPAAVAEAHYISLRHLYTIFSRRQEETVSAWIRARRLEHIRRELTDPLHRDAAVSSIAARWGLPNAAHFSRLFKSEFGVTPTTYRRRHLPETAS
ncbi:helix-turn-helix domain-containing protein [Nesterenkonia halophila]